MGYRDDRRNGNAELGAGDRVNARSLLRASRTKNARPIPSGRVIEARNKYDDDDAEGLRVTIYRVTVVVRRRSYVQRYNIYSGRFFFFFFFLWFTTGLTFYEKLNSF